MIRVLGNRVFGALAGAVFMMAAGTATLPSMANAQVSNSFEALPDEGALEGTYNPIMFQPAEFATMLTDLGMTVASSQAMPEYRGHLIVATVEAVPFLFGFSECDTDGCALLSQVHPSPTTVAGLYVTPQITNALNVEFPLGTMIAEDNGNLVYRYGLPATPGCSTDCMSVHVELFFYSVNELYGFLSEMSGMNQAALESDDVLKGLTTDMPGAATLFAKAGAGNFTAMQMDHLAASGTLAGQGLGMDRLLEIMTVGDVLEGVGQDAWAPLVTGQ